MEFESLTLTIDACKNGDQEAYNKQVRKPCWNMCEPALVRKVRDKKLV